MQEPKGPFLYELAKKQVENINNTGSEPIFGFTIGFILLGLFVFSKDPQAASSVFSAIAALMPLWLPIFLFKVVFILWVDYVRLVFWFSQEYVLLEITLPPEMKKSPASMEVFFSMLNNTSGENTWFDRLFFGKFRAVWSLEIACNEGRISYYIHLRRAWKNILEGRLYGQFPEARIEEVEDYVSKIDFSVKDYDLYGLEFMKAEPQALPIRTYMDYELDKNLDKPELHTEPITHVLELLQTAGKDEYMWFQIVVRGKKKDEWRGLYKADMIWKKIYKTTDIYREKAAKEIKKIVGESMERAKKFEVELNLDRGPLSTTTEGEKRRMDNIERTLAKPALECGLRVVYLAKRDVFKGINIPAIINPFGPFRGTDAKSDYNALVAANRGLIRFNYPWQDFRDILKNKHKKETFHQYKFREYFFVPYNQEPVFLNTEELATLWYFPGPAVQTPGLQRVPSRVAEAPSNLPI